MKPGHGRDRMNALSVRASLDEILHAASRLLATERIAIRCDCENLETVYVESRTGGFSP
jgi:hypothetical protein